MATAETVLCRSRMVRSMDRPESLVGHTVGGNYVCKGWELRVTKRCLEDDLNADDDAPFDSILGLHVVKAFVKDRQEVTYGTRQVSPIECRPEVWVLAQGDRHRGATIYDPEQEIVWLIAYGKHESGSPKDFFPYCKGLAKTGTLLPTEEDYEGLLADRGSHFAEAVRIEAPMLLLVASRTEGEHRCTVGGSLGAGLCVEVSTAPDATAITVAFFATEVEWEQGLTLLAAINPGKWDPVPRMPSRDLEDGEVAFTIMLEKEEL
jgi:hypothetical protein